MPQYASAQAPGGRNGYLDTVRRVLKVATSLLMLAAGMAVVPAGASADCAIPGSADPTMSASQDFSGSFASGLQGSFVQIPFDVPAGTRAIRVRYCYDQPPPGGGPSNTLDMGVYAPLASGDTVWGPKERRGWSGSAVKDLAISENGFTPDSVYLANGGADRKKYVSGYTTRAYEPGPLPAGQWAAELGLAAIAPPPGDPDGIAWRVRVETSSDSLLVESSLRPRSLRRRRQPRPNPAGTSATSMPTGRRSRATRR